MCFKYRGCCFSNYWKQQRTNYYVFYSFHSLHVLSFFGVIFVSQKAYFQKRISFLLFSNRLFFLNFAFIHLSCSTYSLGMSISCMEHHFYFLFFSKFLEVRSIEDGFQKISLYLMVNFPFCMDVIYLKKYTHFRLYFEVYNHSNVRTARLWCYEFFKQSRMLTAEMGVNKDETMRFDSRRHMKYWI